MSVIMYQEIYEFAHSTFWLLVLIRKLIKCVYNDLIISVYHMNFVGCT